MHDIKQLKEKLEEELKHLQGTGGDFIEGRKFELKNVLGLIDEIIEDKQEMFKQPLMDAVVDEMARVYGLGIYNTPWALDSTGVAYPLHYAEFGARWQKEQMMKEDVLK